MHHLLVVLIDWLIDDWLCSFQMPGFDPHAHMRPPLANVPGGKP